MNVMKTELRAEMRRIRRSIVDGAGRVDALWTSVLAACRELGARTVMAFVGFGSEPDTTGLIELLRSNGITVVLPRIEGDHIVGVVHAHGMNLAIGPFGIPAPTGSAIEPTTIDVVLLPGLAFTRDGRRLGQGGGFYDRFLPLLGPDATTIGVCFREQLVEQLVTEPHDRIVDLVISDDVRE
jgi:5-formyltetrahydrofolate cyclo-ligase